MAESGVPVRSYAQRSPLLADALAVLGPAADLLDKLFYDDVSTVIDDDSVSVWISLLLDGELRFELPGGFAVGFGKGDGVTPLTLGLRVSAAGVAVRVEQLAVTLEVPTSLLRPAPPIDGGEAPAKVELVLEGAVEFAEDRRFRVEGFESVALPRCFVGGSSIVISAEDVSIDTAHGLVLGVATVELPKDLPQLAPEELVLENAIIGPAGVSGRLEAHYTPAFDAAAKTFTGHGAGVLASVPFAFAEIAIELHENSLVEASLSGQLLLPYFEVPTAVEIALRSDNSFSLTLGGDPPLATIEREGVLRIDLETLGFEVTQGKLQLHAGGMITLLVGDTESPSFRATDVVVDADGNLSAHGLGLVLRDGKPFDFSVPGVTFDKLDVSGNPLDEGLVVDAELSASLTEGPFIAVLQGVGVHARLALEGTRPVAHDLDVRPPRRIAIGVESELVTGGGFLESDEARTRFAGGLELKISRYGIAALALLEKQEGTWSLLAVLAGRFPGIPLGFGFFLDGVGGLLATHRRIDVDRLRTGLRDHTLDGVLFPEDIAKHGIAMVEKLGAAFPFAHGRYVLGPMLKIGWGVTRIVSAEIAVIFEVPAPLKIVFLAQVHASLPRADKALIVLNIDALGVLDLPGKRLSLDATLHDSKLVGYDISGDLCVRFGWGKDAELITSVGGFHPRFEPPPEVPALRRLAVVIGTNPRVTLELYLALTSNTAQLGARATLVVSKAGFSIDAGFSFDALFQFDPFAFEVDLTAWAAIKWHGKSLAGVRLEGALSGPAPWHAHGKASFDVLWWSVSVDFDETFGRDEREQLEAAPDPGELVRLRLADPRSWWAEVRGGAAVKLARYDGTELVVDPQGSLFVKQDAVPLDCTITRIGARKLPAPAKVSIHDISVRGNSISFTPLDSQFAPAEFIEMSEADKLAAPGFEPMRAGAALGDTTVRIGAGRRNIAIEYDAVIVDPEHHEPPSGPRTMEPLVFEAVLAIGASARARGGRLAAVPPRFVIVDPGWTVASADDLSATSASGTFVEARERLHEARAGGARVVLVQLHEVEP